MQHLVKQMTSSLEDDLQQICHLEQQLFINDSWDKTALHSLATQDYNYFFVLSSDNKIIGYCIVQVMFDTAEILRIGIDKNFQGQGLAKQLLQYVLDFLHTTDSEKLLLEVRGDNVSAIKLYQNFEFTQIHVRKNYYKNQYSTATDALIMQKVLA